MSDELSWYVGVATIGGPLLAFLLVLVGFFLVRPDVALSRGAKTRMTVIVVGAPVAWISAAMLLAHEGIFRAVPGVVFPPIVLGISAPILAGLLFVLRSESFGHVLDAVPQQWIVGIQFYRTLGIVFLVLFGMGILPGAFAQPAGWGDVLVGVLAVPVAYLALRPSALTNKLVFGWNMLGLADLVAAVATGFLSSPGRFQLLSLDFPNVHASAFPLVMIPLFAVPMSVLLHGCSLRKLRRQAAQMAAPQGGFSSA